MNMEKLKVGQMIKNYKELCAILDIPVLGGNAKQSQVKEFNRFCLHEKKGNSFSILEIYDYPLEREDERRSGNRGIYSKAIEFILSDMLSKQAGNKFYITKLSLAKDVGLVTPNYRKIADEKILKSLGIYSWQLNDFYNETSSKYHSILTSAIKNLSNRKILSCRDVYFVCHRDGACCLATDDERVTILAAEQYALENLELETIQEVFFKSKRNQYQKLLAQYLEEHTDWLYFYKSLEFLYLQDKCQAVSINIWAEMKNNNDAFCAYIEKRFEQKFQSNQEKVAEYEEFLNNRALERIACPFNREEHEKPPFDFAKSVNCEYLIACKKLTATLIQIPERQGK